LTVLDLAGQDTPVYPGCADALVVPTPQRATSHGADGLGDSGYPPSTRRAKSEHAVQALIRLANEAEGELTLIALGPLTNLAIATKLDPYLPGKYKRLVVMGGAITAMGNSWTPAAEFNLYVDPEAAAVVFQSWPGLTLVAWETVMQAALEPRQVEELSRIDSPRAEFFRRSIKRRYLNQLPGWNVLFEADPLAMAVALEPEIVLRSEQRFVEVELGGRSTRGQTVVDWFELNGRPPNVNLVREIDQERFWELMKQSLR
jgi:purine nucleosidase